MRTLLVFLLFVMVFGFTGKAETATAVSQSLPPLTVADRVACQTSIEEVYWQYRLWPAQNPGPKPTLAEVMPNATIEAKVSDTLAKSQALTEFWEQPITGQMLQAELDRMAAKTQRPEILQHIWQVLGNDPALVAECLARPTLVNRLMKDWYAQDERFQGTPFAQWWAQTKLAFSPNIETPVYPYHQPYIAQAQRVDDTWQSTPAIPGQTLGEGVWTGTEMLYLGNRITQGYRYNPATDTWDTMTTVGAPHRVNDFTAVWTGTEMITWGGCTGAHEFCTTNGGGRYNPATDSWTPTSTVGTPDPRRKHGAVWTGSDMIVWGGCTEDSNGNQNCNIVFNDGGRYNPATNSWQPVTMSNAPTPRIFPPLVWTDDEMIVWSGSAAASPGGRYNPTSNTWQSISTTNAPAGNDSSLVWTGTEVVAWGGCTGVPFCDTFYNSGGRYNPDTNSWTPTSDTSAPAARSDHKAVWTGSEMLVWGGYNGSSYPAAGGRYNPVTDTWSVITTTNGPAGRGEHQAFWTGSLLLVWGGWGSNGSARDGARYNPATDSWTPISANDPFSFREHHTAIWTGTEMIVWGGYGDGTAATGLNTGRIYDPITNTWDETSVTNAPSPRASHSVIWTGTEMIIWGGNTESWSLPGDGGRYNPMTDSWSNTNTTGAPEAPSDHSAVWTGAEMIVWGGSIFDNPWGNGGGRYNPTTNSWTAVSTSGAPTGRYLHTAVWTGSEMLLWGGAGSTGTLGNGARYNPTTNSWAPISTTNDPSARVLHTAIWDGAQMIIWGGSEDYSPWINTNTGGLYDPASDTWIATSLANAPAARARHTVVWTGDEMIVWSGCTSTDMSCLQGDAHGGRYNPQTNAWMATSTVHAPEARQWHTAVWTGDEMIVWGGTTDDNGLTNTGGRYYAETSGNNAPQALNDTYTLEAGTTLTVTAPGVLENDTDPEGDPLTAVLVGSPAHGAVDLQADGSFTYTPDAGYVGTDSFTYQASDGDRLSNVAAVGLTITAVNTAPTAQADSYTVDEDTLLSVGVPGVLGNDDDPNGDALTAVLVETTTHGTLTLNEDGAFTYQPDENFNGQDSFTYQATDGSLWSNVAVVTLTIDSVNDAPTAVPDSYTVAANTVLTVTAPGLLANDLDVEGDTLVTAVAVAPGHGMLQLQPDGSFVYTPDTGFSGIDTFDYTVSDGLGGVATATVTIQVTDHLYTLYLPVVLHP